jgi:hypothetical protein
VVIFTLEISSAWVLQEVAQEIGSKGSEPQDPRFSPIERAPQETQALASPSRVGIVTQELFDLVHDDDDGRLGMSRLFPQQSRQRRQGVVRRIQQFSAALSWCPIPFEGELESLREILTRIRGGLRPRAEGTYQEPLVRALP